MKLLRNQTLHGIGAHAHLPVSFGVISKNLLTEKRMKILKYIKSKFNKTISVEQFAAGLWAVYY